MNSDFGTLLNHVGKTADEISLRGWAEANAGNISIRIDGSIFTEKSSAKPVWKDIGCSLPRLAGDFFLVSGAGTYLKNFSSFPADDLGVIEINSEGDKYKVVWGYQNGLSPTSELATHLLAQSTRKKISKGADKVILHCHCPNITALGFTENLDTARLTSLLWQMHSECLIMLPDGVEYIPWLMPGSAALAEATAKAFEKRRAVVWQYHGIVAAGPDLDQTLGIIHIIEKTCGLFLQAKASGGIKSKITKQQLIDIAGNFNLTPDEEILSQIE
jgi:rhamnulose-1-phosphate aldolase